MIQFLLGEFKLRWSEIEEAARKYEFCAYSPGGTNPLKPPDDFIELTKIVSGFRHICRYLELEETANQTDLFERVIEHEPCTYQSVNSHLKNLIITANNEIQKLQFIFIPPENAKYFEGVGIGFKTLFGVDVYNNFPLARADIKDAGNCLATDLHDAAVFHLLRIVEMGLRELAKNIGFKKLAKAPLDYAGWDGLVNAIDDKLEEKIPKTRGHKKSSALKFKSDLLADFKAFGVLRTELMHGRGHHNKKQAIGLFEKVNEFMDRLDKHLFPVKKSNAKRRISKKIKRATEILGTMKKT